MSSVRDRLLRLTRSVSTQQEQDRPPQEMTAPDESMAWQAFEADIIENDYGSFVRRVRRYALHEQHGYYELQGLFRYADVLASLGAERSDLSCKQLLFFDIESTGLGVGAGNVPFMFGCGYFTADSFIIEQGLIRHPGEEPAMLVYLNMLLQRFTHLISYNGRSFDWPVVKNRYVLNRLKLEDEHMEHMDFLYPARSLWRHVLPSCSLGSVEEERLGVKREEDVPGSMAPSLYFQFIAANDPEVLRGVWIHNEHDILTLAGLATHFVHLLRGDIPLTEMEPEEVLRLGLWLDKVGEEARAEEVFQSLISRPLARIRKQLLPLAAWYKRCRKLEEAVRLWSAAIEGLEETLVQSAIDPIAFLSYSPEPCIELAMYYEHKLKQWDLALYYSRLARQLVLQKKSYQRKKRRADLEFIAALDHRIHRIEDKLSKAQELARIEHLQYDLFS